MEVDYLTILPKLFILLETCLQMSVIDETLRIQPDNSQTCIKAELWPTTCSNQPEKPAWETTSPGSQTSHSYIPWDARSPGSCLQFPQTSSLTPGAPLEPPPFFHHKAFPLLLLWVSAKHEWWWLSPLLERSVVSVLVWVVFIYFQKGHARTQIIHFTLYLKRMRGQIPNSEEVFANTYVIKSSNPNTQRSLKTQL